MNTKKIAVILISTVFALVVLFSCVGLLAVRKVEVSYAVSDERSVTDIQAVLDKYVGKNLLFLSEEEVKQSISGEYHLEVLSVQKRFPNVLSVSIRERKEVYYLNTGDRTLILDKAGFIVNSFMGTPTENSEIITLSFSTPTPSVKPIEVYSTLAGNNLRTDNDKVVYEVFNIAEQVGLTDCIKSIEVIDATMDNFHVLFETRTGVEIHVYDILKDGLSKCVKGFEVYDTVASDYQKRFGEIRCFYVEGSNTFRIMHAYDGQNDILYDQEI